MSFNPKIVVPMGSDWLGEYIYRLGNRDLEGWVL